MDAKARTVRDILYAGDQYLIPFFQRHYSWKLRNWQQLWDDVQLLTDDGGPRQHFLGPLVCTPINHMPGDMPEYQLIDGQQRLTTLTVLLSVLRDVAKEQRLTDLADDIAEKYLFHKREKGLKRYKVIPRVGDREVLFAVVDGKSADRSRRDGIIRAHRFFKATITEALGTDVERRLKGLLTAVTSKLSLVVVTVDGENPYEIFESLNSTGLPLAESDLIRNFVFMQVPLAEQEEFYREQWQSFESMFDATDDFDAVDMTAFYRDYLMRDGAYCRKGSTFVDFKGRVKAHNLEPAPLLEDLTRHARFDLMLRRKQTAGDDRLEAALDQVDLLEVTTAYPLLIHLLNRHGQGKLPLDELLACIADIESFVIRRSICGESTRSYGENFVAAIRAIVDSPRDDLRSYWAGRGWPDDETFIARLIEFALYRREPSKGLLILEALERSYGHKERPELEELTIEHVMPQSITEGKYAREWQEALGNDWQKLHATWLHSLGNLTLTGYNPKLSNRSFSKKKELFEESNVELNKYFQPLRSWDTQTIQRRGAELAQQVAKLWPRPVSQTYEPGAPEVRTVVETTRAELKALRGEYWKEFVQDALADDATLQPKRDAGESTVVAFPSQRAGTVFDVTTVPDEASIAVRLSFRGKHATTNLNIIRQDEDAIEKALGAQLDWDPDGSPANVAVHLDSVELADRGDWPRQHAWLSSQLRQLRAVLVPRLCTRFELPTELKTLRTDFMRAFDRECSTSFEALRAKSIKPSTYREFELLPGLTARATIQPEENWISAGLHFNDDPSHAHFDALKRRMTELPSESIGRIYVEDDGDVRWLGAYRLALLADASNWPKHVRWLKETVAYFAKMLRTP